MCMASAMASKSRRLSRISCRRLGLCLKEVWVGVVGEAVGSGGGGGGGGLVPVVGVWDGGEVEGGGV